MTVVTANTMTTSEMKLDISKRARNDLWFEKVSMVKLRKGILFNIKKLNKKKRKFKLKIIKKLTYSNRNYGTFGQNIGILAITFLKCTNFMSFRSISS